MQFSKLRFSRLSDLYTNQQCKLRLTILQQFKADQNKTLDITFIKCLIFNTLTQLIVA